MKLILLCLTTYAGAETLVEQASNPHIQDATCAEGAFADLLERPYLSPLTTQGDTLQGVTSARTPGGARVTLYGFKQPKRLSAAELPFSVAPVQWPRNDPRLLVDSAAPHADSWFEGYGWRVVGASTPCVASGGGGLAGSRIFARAAAWTGSSGSWPTAATGRRSWSATRS